MHLRTPSVLLAAFPLALVLLLGPAAAWAQYGSANENASISLYLLPGTSPPNCSTIDRPDCANDELQGEGTLYTPYYAALAVFNADGEEGIAGLSCGLDYNGSPNQGVDIWSWTVCADGQEYPGDGTWPASGGGTRITWLTCQNEEPGGKGTGVTAIFGFFYLTAYSEDIFRITKNNNVYSPELVVGSCAAKEAYLNYPGQAGWVGFSDDGSVKGNVQCGKPKEDTTWGDVKARYGNR